MSDNNTPKDFPASAKGEPIRSEHIPLGLGYAVQFSFMAGALAVKWKPSMPTGANRRRVLPAYVRARDCFLAGAAAQTGRSVAVMNADGSVSVFGASR